MLVAAVVALAIQGKGTVTITCDFDQIEGADFGSSEGTRTIHGSEEWVYHGDRNLVMQGETVDGKTKEIYYGSDPRVVERRGPLVLSTKHFSPNSSEIVKMTRALKKMGGLLDSKDRIEKKGGRVRVNGVLCEMNYTRMKVADRAITVTTAVAIEEPFAPYEIAVESQSSAEEDGQVGMWYTSRYNLKLKRNE